MKENRSYYYIYFIYFVCVDYHLSTYMDGNYRI